MSWRIWSRKDIRRTPPCQVRLPLAMPATCALGVILCSTVQLIHVEPLYPLVWHNIYGRREVRHKALVSSSARRSSRCKHCIRSQPGVKGQSLCVYQSMFTVFTSTLGRWWKFLFTFTFTQLQLAPSILALFVQAWPHLHININYSFLCFTAAVLYFVRLQNSPCWYFNTSAATSTLLIYQQVDNTMENDKTSKPSLASKPQADWREPSRACKFLVAYVSMCWR